MKKTDQAVDCMAIKRAAALRIYETTKDMSPEEELEYWRRRDEELGKKYPAMRAPDEANRPRR